MRYDTVKLQMYVSGLCRHKLIDADYRGIVDLYCKIHNNFGCESDSIGKSRISKLTKMSALSMIFYLIHN